MACRRFVVSGRVQGVWFRASTQREAQLLGLSGHAVNLPDGSVEVLACGAETAVQALEAWLWRGPELAAVSEVRSEDAADPEVSGFRTG